MSRFIAAVAVALSLFATSAVLAQPTTDPTLPSTTLDMTEIILEGGVIGPDNMLVDGSLVPGSTSLVPDRLSFVDRITLSAEQLP